MLSTPLLAAYSLGLTGSSFGFWGNVAARRWGVMPIISGQLRVQEKLGSLQKASMWSAFYESAKGDMLLTLAYAIPSVVYIAYEAPAGSLMRTLATVSALSYAMVGPWTALGIMPVNHQIQGLVDAKSEENASGKLTALLQSWKNRNDLRMVLFFGAWSSLVASIFARL